MNFEFLSTATIEEIHVEVSNLCNAACPMCARNNSGYGLTKNPGWGHWKKGDEILVFSKDLLNLKKVYFCGTHGDPITYPYLPEAVKFCKSRNLTVEIFTNGSLRSEKWWNNLLDSLDKDDKIVFGIDGLETNHLYRQNTDINKILKNLKLAVSKGITVQWDFLVFKHNEHELDKCQRLAKDIGVKHFRIKKTPRFKKDIFEVKDKFNNTSHFLEPPNNVKLRHPNFEKIKESYNQLPLDYKINCLYKEAKKIYVNSRVEVFPCCYISDSNEKKMINNDLSKVEFPIEKVSLRTNTWSDILSLPFYKEELIKSFNSDNTLNKCIFTCGIFNREKNQSERVDL